MRLAQPAPEKSPLARCACGSLSITEPIVQENIELFLAGISCGRCGCSLQLLARAPGPPYSSQSAG